MVDTNEKHQTAKKANSKTSRRSIVSLRRRQRRVTMLLGAAILISGIGIGFGSAMAYLGGSKEVAATDEEPKQPTKVAMHISRDMTTKYKLDEEQAGKVKEIMTKRLKALREIRTKAMEEMVAVHREITSDMKSVLSPEQFKQWTKRLEEARKRSRFRHHRRRHPRSQRGDYSGRGRYGGRSGMSGMFKRLDKDGNNELTKDEIGKLPERFRQSLQKADVNGDGKVDKKEYETHLRRRRPPSRPGRDRRSSDRNQKPHNRPTPSSEPAQDLSMLWL